MLSCERRNVSTIPRWSLKRGRSWSSINVDIQESGRRITCRTMDDRMELNNAMKKAQKRKGKVKKALRLRIEKAKRGSAQFKTAERSVPKLLAPIDQSDDENETLET